MSDEIKSSPNQSLLDSYIKLINENVSDSVIKEAYLNEPNANMPTLIVEKDHLVELTKLLKKHEDLDFNFLMNLSGVDYEEYMEVVYHLYSYSRDTYLALKVQTERDGGSVPTIIDIYLAADWQEREVYDLLGINFTGREITRILLSDDWVGHPLRKDYVQVDEEV